MEIKIPYSIIKNDGIFLDSNAFMIYLRLLELKELNGTNIINFEAKSFRESVSINDNRTLKKCFDALYKRKLINKTFNKFSVKFKDMVNLLEYKNEKCISFNTADLKYVDNLGTIGLRIVCYLMIYYEIQKENEIFYGEMDIFSYRDIISNEKISQKFGIARDTVNKYTNKIRKSVFNYLLIKLEESNVTSYVEDHDYTFVKSNKKYKEKELELKLIKDLSVIEQGLILIKNQYQVKDGFIDILARDKNDILCIIELKVVPDDEKLIFQSVYYPTRFTEPTRMITITPDYEDKIKVALDVLGVETKTYKYENDKLLVS